MSSLRAARTTAAGYASPPMWRKPSQVASWVIGPLVVLALVTGIAQALLLRWGLTRYWRVAIKLAVTVVFTGLVWFVLIPRLADNADAATTGQVFTTAEKLPLAIVPAVAVVGPLVLVGLAVYKPRARLRRDRRTRPHANHPRRNRHDLR